MSTKWIEARKTICIDWNGVLDTYVGWNDGMPYPPRDGAKEFLQELNSQGYDVVILSSADSNDILKWLIDNDMLQYVCKITNVKVPALVYLDDRGITFDGNFSNALEAIKTFKTHWESEKYHEGGYLGK
jgi:predicted phosphatase